MAGKEFSYEIVKQVAVLSKSPKGWTKEVNVISWNGGTPKYDIRDWTPDHSKMGKGVTLSVEEAVHLLKALQEENLLCADFFLKGLRRWTLLQPIHKALSSLLHDPAPSRECLIFGVPAIPGNHIDFLVQFFRAFRQQPVG